jgi:hypothetical protein
MRWHLEDTRLKTQVPPYLSLLLCLSMVCGNDVCHCVWMKFEELSIKDLKDLLQKKSSESSSEISTSIRISSQKIIDKSELVELCKCYIGDDEIERLLQSAQGSSSQLKKNHSSPEQPQFPSSSLNLEMDQLSKMSPEQLKYQAACIRKNPSAFRASQPALFHMTDTQILQAATQMEMMAANPSAFQAMQEQVKNMTPDQMERLRQAHSTTGSGGGRGGSSASRNVSQEAAEYAEMSPEQMRYRAECMRKHPEIVRASNPMMASLSDADICAAADQMEAMASSNPNFMKEMSEYLSNMPEEERNLFQQSMKTNGTATGGAAKGVGPSSSSSSTSPSLPEMLNLSEAQIEMVVKSFKSNPEMTKRMLRSQGMMTDEQINQQYDFLCSMDEESLKSTLKTMLSVQKYLQPLTKYYEVLNLKTGGYGGVILGAIGAVLLAIVVVALWKIVNQLWYGVFYKGFEYFSSSTGDGEGASDSTATRSAAESRPAAAVVTTPDDEFEF